MFGNVGFFTRCKIQTDQNAYIVQENTSTVVRSGETVRRNSGPAVLFAALLCVLIILPMTWLYLELVFNQSSAYIGGEVRLIVNDQLYAVLAGDVGGHMWSLGRPASFEARYAGASG